MSGSSRTIGSLDGRWRRPATIINGLRTRGLKHFRFPLLLQSLAEVLPEEPYGGVDRADDVSTREAAATAKHAAFVRA